MLAEVHVPPDVDAALELVRAGGLVLGGGTTLMPRLNENASPDTALVSLRRVGLGDIAIAGDTVTLGAAATLAAIERDERVSLLHPVVRSIASPNVRTLATVGGNLFAAQPHGDLAVALLALDAEVDLIDDSGPGTLPLEELLALPRKEPMLITAIRFAFPPEGDFRFHKAARRRLNSASIVTIAAVVSVEGERVGIAKVAIGGATPTAVRARAIEAVLTGSVLDAATVAQAAAAGDAEIAPRDDAYASAWYRRRVFPVHLRRALLGNDSIKEK